MIVEGDLNIAVIQIDKLVKHYPVQAHLHRGLSIFPALSPVVMPLKIDSVTSRLRSALDGITTGDRAQKAATFPRWRNATAVRGLTSL